MRDIVVALFLLGIFPFAFSSANVAYILWVWTGLASINSYVYSFMVDVPLVLIFASITLALIALGRTSGVGVFGLNRTSWIMILVIVHGLFSATFAFDGLPRNWELFTNMVKTVLVCILMPMFVNSRTKINLFLLVILLSISFHGALDGLKFVASGGAHNARGLAKFGDNNHYAMVLVMVLPLALYTYHYASSRWIRWGSIGVFVLMFFAMIATHSRGALVSVVVMGAWIIIVGRKKLTGLLLAALLAFFAFQLAPAGWFERMDTISRADEDASFMGRVGAWKRASAIALEHPVLGGGYHAGQGAGEIFQKFRYKQGLLGFVDTPDIPYAAASHSIYFEVLGDLGFLGLILFLLCLFNVFYTRIEVLRLVKARGQNYAWAEDLVNYVAAGVLAFMVGGALLSAAYFELPYYLMMIVQVIKLVIERQNNN